MEKKETILIVDDEPGIVSILEKRLTHTGYTVEIARNGKQAVAKVLDVMPDLIVLDVMMPEGDGMQVKAELNKDKATAAIPVIFLSAKSSLEDKVKGLCMMADDYVVKPFEFEELLFRIRNAVNRRKYYEKISTMDYLTALPNLHFFKKQLLIAFSMARRYHSIFSLALFDIDSLKAVNDSYGHAAGDGVLQKMADTMKHIFRKSDVVARYGGDEFVVLFHNTDGERVKLAVDRLRETMHQEPYAVKGTDAKIEILFSHGIATYHENMSNETELFELADRNMYEHKRMKKT